MYKNTVLVLKRNILKIASRKKDVSQKWTMLQQIGTGRTFCNVQITVFWNVMPCSLVNKCRNVKSEVLAAVFLTIQAFCGM
jgi:hypothetical protein